HRNRRYVEQPVEQEKPKERPETLRKGGAKQRQTANHMAKGEEFFRGKIAIGELVGEKDSKNRRNPEDAAHQRLLPRFEPTHSHVGKNLWLPGTPNGDFEHHHDKERVSDGGRIHEHYGVEGRLANRKRAPRGAGGPRNRGSSRFQPVSVSATGTALPTPRRLLFTRYLGKEISSLRMRRA